MEYNKIISITGKPGLFELLSTRADGAVVRSLEDGTTKFVSSRQHQFSHLESIEVYTVKENISLKDVFVAMKNSTENLPDAKAETKALKAYFEKVYAELDFDRVFTSDLKKMVKWYQVLTKQNINFEEATEEVVKDQEQKPHHDEKSHVKTMKPQQTNPKKIESRGVK